MLLDAARELWENLSTILEERMPQQDSSESGGGICHMTSALGCDGSPHLARLLKEQCLQQYEHLLRARACRGRCPEEADAIHQCLALERQFPSVHDVLAGIVHLPGHRQVPGASV